MIVAIQQNSFPEQNSNLFWHQNLSYNLACLITIYFVSVHHCFNDQNQISGRKRSFLHSETLCLSSKNSLKR